MSKSFQESFTIFINDRTDIAQNTMEKDPEYNEYNKEFYRIYNKIKVLVPFDLISDLESAVNTREGIAIEHAYRQGLKDSVLLRQELGLTN